MFLVGDLVGYSPTFLRSIGVDQTARGCVGEVVEIHGPRYVRVKWQGESKPRLVAIASLEKRRRYQSCVGKQFGLTVSS